MNAADEERLNTWTCEIVDAIVEGVQWRQEGDERRVLGQGGLSVNTRTGAWYHHSAGKGGWSAIALPLFALASRSAQSTSIARSCRGLTSVTII